MITQQLTQELRTLSYLLHPPLLDEAGLEAALSWYTNGFSERSGLPIAVYVADDLGRLAAEHEMTIFRVVQECMSNIHRHAAATNVEIRLWRCDRSSILEVVDDGRGIPAAVLAGCRPGEPSELGVGIAGMRERVAHLDGRFEIFTAERAGTRIRVTLPIESGLDK